MIRPLALLLVALIAGATATGCAALGPSVETRDVFEAATWPPDESLTYQVVNTAGEVIGSGVLSAAEEGETLVLRQDYRELDTPSGATPSTDTTTVIVDAGTFRPVSGERVIVRRSDDGATTERWDWRYDAVEGEPALVSTHTENDGDASERTLRLRDHYYDNESSLWLWRSVSLDEEHEDHYISVNPIDRAQHTVQLRVPQTEKVTVPAGEFEAYRLLFRTGRAVRTAWIEAAEPHRVLRWDNGDVILELLPE